MDFSTIFQLRAKRFWWMDVIFYFVISLFIATVLCWLIFLFKNDMIKNQIKDQVSELHQVGTKIQKDQEKNVINYRKKINDFDNLLKNHAFTSNVLIFMETQTMPNVWFNSFSLDAKNTSVQLSGESEDMDTFSRQIAVFENNKYIKSIGTLSSVLGGSSRISFNMNLSLDKSMLGYLANSASTPDSITKPGDQQINGLSMQPSSDEKLITSFRLLLANEIVGNLDQTNHTIIINVPYGIDITNLIPAITISEGANILPASNVPQDFTMPVTYTVTAQDDSSQNYTARVVVASPPETAKTNNQLGFITTIIIISVAVIIILVLILLFLKKNKK